MPEVCQKDQVLMFNAIKRPSVDRLLKDNSAIEI